MNNLPGAFAAKKKNGTIYYRSSITFRSKHISLGSFDTEAEAHSAYNEAREIINSTYTLLPDDYSKKNYPHISFSKWICLINFKNNGFYIKTPIYLKNNYFSYYLSASDELIFDADDLFFYSNHSIMRRGNHLFVAEYGMQTNIRSRYGIKNFARPDIDYRFVNGNSNDFRYSNIEIFNRFNGVTCTKNSTGDGNVYTTKIHINGDYIVGRYDTAIEAAIAYNKAIDYSKAHGITKNFEKNYLEQLSADEYQSIYFKIKLSKNLNALFK